MEISSHLCGIAACVLLAWLGYSLGQGREDSLGVLAALFLGFVGYIVGRVGGVIAWYVGRIIIRNVKGPPEDDAPPEGYDWKPPSDRGDREDNF